MLSTWAFNPNTRGRTELARDQAAAIAWIQKNALRVDELADPDVMERALTALASKLDGTPAAANTYRRKRPVFYAALKYAVKRKHLAANPLADDDIDFTAPKAVETVDPRTVPNPKQARALISAAGKVPPSGPALEAFFGCLYYCGMRPGESARIRETDFVLPRPTRTPRPRMRMNGVLPTSIPPRRASAAPGPTTVEPARNAGSSTARPEPSGQCPCRRRWSG